MYHAKENVTEKKLILNLQCPQSTAHRKQRKTDPIQPSPFGQTSAGASCCIACCCGGTIYASSSINSGIGLYGLGLGFCIRILPDKKTCLMYRLDHNYTKSPHPKPVVLCTEVPPNSDPFANGQY